MTCKHYPDSDPFEDRYYLVLVGDYYNERCYLKPNCVGYTSNIMEAGLFGKEWAMEEVMLIEGLTMELAL